MINPKKLKAFFTPKPGAPSLVARKLPNKGRWAQTPYVTPSQSRFPRDPRQHQSSTHQYGVNLKRHEKFLTGATRQVPLSKPMPLKSPSPFGVTQAELDAAHTKRMAKPTRVPTRGPNAPKDQIRYRRKK